MFVTAPEGTKLWILDLGANTGDMAWFLRGRNASSVSTPRPEHERRTLRTFAFLIDHPDIGLVLYDCGPVADPGKAWGPIFTDAFPWVGWTEANRLDRAIELTGNRIEDVKAIYLSHLHLDHAGGLAHFADKSIPVHVHADELKQAFYAVATKEDYGNYLPDYLDFDRNWQPFTGDVIEVAAGMTLHHLPGHAIGLVGLLLNLKVSGSILFASDQCFFEENILNDEPPGWGLRDQNAWYASLRKVKRLAALYRAPIFYGHDARNLDRFKPAPFAYT